MSQRQLRNVQKSKMHVQSCCFANLNLFFFCRSRCRRRCLSSLWLSSKNFSTMVTLRHTSPLYLLLRYLHKWNFSGGNLNRRDVHMLPGQV